jgi:DNA polymerase-3 subunit alpha
LRYTPVVHPEGSAIRFGLGGIKGVGVAAAEAIIAERKKNGPFKSFVDFCERVDNASANSRAIECLIKAGAFDFTGVPRGCLVQKIPVVAEHAARTRADHANGQRSLLDLLGDDEDTGLRLTDKDLTGPDPWTLTTKLNFEREMIGFFVSGHPLAKHEWILRAYNQTKADKIASLPNDSRTRIGGLVARLAKRTTKKVPPTQWLSFDLETLEGNVSCAVFGESVSAVGGKLSEGAEVMLVGTVRTNDRGTSLSVDEVHPLEEVPKLFSAGLNVKLSSKTATKENVAKMKELFARFPGKTPVTFFVKQPDGGGTARVVSDAKVEIADELLKGLKEVADGVSVASVSDAGLESPRRRFRGPPGPR